MRAMVLREQGGLDKLTFDSNFPDPEIGHADVLLRVRATSLNYHDIFTRRGMPGIKIPLPVIMGLDVAGEIVKVGQTVAVDISRPTKEGESSTPTMPNVTPETEPKAEKSSATNSQANSNENKPKRKPVNRNTNDNLNTNANRLANQNRNANANRTPAGNLNLAPPMPGNLNSNRPGSRGTANRRAGNLNTNRRAPVAAPTP